MSPERPRRSIRELRASYDETLDAVRRRFEQLESAVAQFSPDLDETAFTAAWSSDDPIERNRADSVLSSFEKTYMLLMDLIALSVKIGRRLGVVTGDEKSSPVEVLRELKVLSADAEWALRVQREVRNSSQHVYVELSVADLREATKQQLDTSPRIIRGIASWVKAFPPEPAEEASSPD